MTTAAAPSLTRRRLASILFFAFMAFLLFGHGIDRWSIGSASVLVILGAASVLTEARLRQPTLNYARLALVSTAIGLVLIAMPVMARGDLTIGAILWAAITLGGLIWVIHYQRTEPR